MGPWLSSSLVDLLPTSGAAPLRRPSPKIEIFHRNQDSDHLQKEAGYHLLLEFWDLEFVNGRDSCFSCCSSTGRSSTRRVGGFRAYRVKVLPWQQIASSKQLDKRHRALNQALPWLLALRSDKHKEVETQSHKDTTNVYNLWVNRISKIEAEVASLNNKYEELKKKKLRSWKRSNLSEKMAMKLKEAVELSDQLPNDILVDKPPEPILKVFNIPQIKSYPTLQGALEEILQLLKNDRVKSITVCGHKGTEAEIQQRIANRLLVERDGFDFAELARRLHRELEKKRYLLILDEVVHQIDLKSLGILNDNNGSKVIIITRYSWVCKSYLVDRQVRLPLLVLDDEAWKMFQDILGLVIDTLGIRHIARRICKQCSRLPLLIHKIASSFKHKETTSSWQAGLDDFKPWPQLGIEGLTELYSCLEFCYDQLKEKNKQKCFLYTSLCPVDSKIDTDYLVESWIAQRFLGDVNATIKYQGSLTSDKLFQVTCFNIEELSDHEKCLFQGTNSRFFRTSKLVVEDCAIIEVLIMLREVTEREWNLLPKLKVIILANLSKLKTICLNENLAWPSLELLHIQNCPELRSLAFNMTNAANLRTIKGDRGWWSNLDWTDNQVQERFRYAFSSST
ncbi:disease resistance protein At4g27190-like [Prosopis cineraria]|uniref:disease resistance protein At4g27190-like n=1 Tax=Prosopis cineraria TaxID=364024 RepID=UPI002410B625|nr:disease resistance protein At4g27190-like [Prosopis cineraria]